MFCPIFPTPSSGLSYCFIFVKTMTLLIKRPSFFDATLILMMSNIHSKFFFFKINHYDHEIYKSPLPETEVFFNNRLIWISPNNFTDISNVHYFFSVCLLVLFFFSEVCHKHVSLITGHTIALTFFTLYMYM